MTHKVYEYEGKHYCEEDISCADPKYAGGEGEGDQKLFIE